MIGFLELLHQCLLSSLSSALNNLVHQCGTVSSYDWWEETVEDDDYRWDDFLSHFQKSADYVLLNTSKRPENASVPSPSNFTFTPF